MVNFETGKWYMNCPNYYARCSIPGEFGFSYDIIIMHKQYLEQEGHWSYHNDMKEASLEEIQEFLADNHPDKLCHNTPINDFSIW